MAVHISYEFTPDMIPTECVKDCSSSGDVTEVVDYWVSKLEMTVDREKAIDCLDGYGAWERDELGALTDEEIAHKVLWLACCDFSEGGDCFVLE